jgi:SSS family solute:Na+ symporter
MLLGMFWKRITSSGAFYGLIAGMLTSFFIFLGFKLEWFDRSASELLTFSASPSEMSRNLWQAVWAWVVCAGLTVLISLFTKPKPDSELVGLVKGLTAESGDEKEPLLRRPAFWAAASLLVLIGLNIYFW